MGPEVALEMFGGVDRVAGDQDAPRVRKGNEQRLQAACVAGSDDRADAAEQLLVAVEQPVVELRPVEELARDLGVVERLLVVLTLDDDFGVWEEKVAAAVVGMQVGVDDVSDVIDSIWTPSLIPGVKTAPLSIRSQPAEITYSRVSATP